MSSLHEHQRVVFTAQSKKYFYCRDAVCQFVFSRGCVPVNPFRVFEYFLGDRVDRDLVRNGNNNLIRIVDALWVFGDTIADGVLAEIRYARELGKPVRYFSIHNRADKITELEATSLKFEQEVYLRTKMTAQQVLQSIGVPEEADGQLPLFPSDVAAN